MKTLVLLCLLGLAAAAPFESVEFDDDDGDNFGGAVFRSGSYFRGDDDDDSGEASYVSVSPSVQTYSAPQFVQSYSVPRTVQTYSAPQFVQSYSVPQANIAKTYAVDITQPQRFPITIAQPQIQSYSAPTAFVAAPVTKTYTSAVVPATYSAPSVARTYFSPSVASVAAPTQVISRSYSVPSFRSFASPVVRRFDFDDDDDDRFDFD